MSIARLPINPGLVDWTGDNSGIYLKEREDGPVICAASLFRIFYSPHGPGHAVVFMWETQADHPFNGLYTDNLPLATWLRDSFAAHFGAFKGNPRLETLPVRELSACIRSGDARTTYTETITGPDLNLTLTWSDLGEPYLVEFTPEHSATGEHEMFSVFVPAGSAEITMNGKRALGRPFSYPVFGKERGTAFLALSETWLRAE